MIESLKDAWRFSVKRNGPILAQAVSGNKTDLSGCLNFLALSWARHGFQFVRVPDSSSAAFVTNAALEVDELYRRYEQRFLVHCNNFAASDVPESPVFLDDADPLEVAPQEITRRALAFMPHFCIEINLIQRVGKHLQEILTRKLSFMEAICPNNDSSMLEALYYGSCSAILFNIVFSGVFEVIARAKDKPLRVLELGAGTGGTTASIIHHIWRYCREYWFTDISHIFLTTAKRRFKENIFRYHILDIDDESEFQVLAAEKFDVVIGSNAVHNAKSLPTALKNINTVLADGGCLLLAETDRIPIWTEFLFGAAPDWWKSGDDVCRSNGPLASPEQWMRMIDEVIGDSFAAVTAEFLPIVDEDYLRNFPQIIVAVKPESHTIAPVDKPFTKQESVRELVLIRTGIDTRGQSFNVADFIDFKQEFIVDLDDEEEKYSRFVAENSERALELCIVLDHKSITDAFCEGKSLEESLIRQWFQMLCFLRTVLAHPNHDHAVSVVTIGAHPIDGGVPNVALSGYHGLFLTIANEYPAAKIRSFDADPSLSPTMLAHSILRFLKRPHRREELSERNGKLLHPVLTRTSLIRPKLALGGMDGTSRRIELCDVAINTPFEIRMGRTRDLDDLDYVRWKPRDLQPNEVEINIHYAALNYRDVMKVLGEYPFDSGDYMNLGDECSGVVTEIGSDVNPALLGRRVMVLGERLLASRTIVSQHQVIPIPDLVSLNEASTIPVAYLTAHYALINVGQLQPGERVLIHSAAGGVGLAAMKVAKARGAQVYATASLPKQDVVTYWGADFVYDSRTLDFERQILEDTDGKGVDVVLNSLSGVYQLASMRLVREFGRFVELGKRDVYANRALNQYDLRRNVSFHVIDMSKLSHGNPDIWKRLLAGIRHALEKGDYQPLPFRGYRAIHVGQALRMMATGRHMGKILIMMQDPAVEPIEPLNKNPGDHASKTLIITGGVTGFGFEIARSFTLAGVGEVILASRSNPLSPTVTAALDALSNYGTSKVSFVQCDVTDRTQVEKLVADAVARSSNSLGVIHAAGIYDDRQIKSIDYDSFRRVCMPKVLGASNLHMATAGMKLDTFCLISSVSSMLGNAGQCSYALLPTLSSTASRPFADLRALWQLASTLVRSRTSAFLLTSRRCAASSAAWG